MVRLQDCRKEQLHELKRKHWEGLDLASRQLVLPVVTT